MPGLIVTAAVRAMLGLHPQLTVDVPRTSWDDQTEVLYDGRADVSYVRLPADQNGLQVRALLAEPRVAVLPAGHRLAGKDTITIADLADEHLRQDPGPVPEWRDIATELPWCSGSCRRGSAVHRRRRYPAGWARCDAAVTMGPPLAEAERDELAHFLTARYRLFTMIAGRLAAAEAEHPQWPLHHAEVLRLDQDLLQRGGLAEPAGAPMAHASPGVPVRIGMWHW